jgi:hypothetical protein
MAAAMTHIRRSLINAGLMVAAMALLASVAPAQNALTTNGALEDIYILHSVREPHEPEANWCAAAKTGFDPFPKDAERLFSFWSLRTRPEDGKVVDAKAARVAKLRACFGPTSERARQNFYAEVQMGSVFFSREGRVPCGHDRFPGNRPFLRPLPTRSEWNAAALYRRAFDNEHDDQQGSAR